MLVVLHLVMQPIDLVAQAPDSRFQRLYVIHEQTHILPNFRQHIHSPLYLTYRVPHRAKVLQAIS